MEKSGTKGIVVHVDETGQHGLLMSIHKVPKKQKFWGAEKLKSELIGALDENNGEDNTKLIVEYAKNHGLALSDAFPLFNWAVNTCGEGWYIPSINELIIMAKNLNDGNLNDFDIKNETFKAFDNNLKKAKGESLVFDKTIMPILSSTELKDKIANMVFVNALSLEVTYKSKEGAIAKGVAAGLVGTSINTGKGNFVKAMGGKTHGASLFSRAFYKF